jgi:hypothetical protein
MWSPRLVDIVSDGMLYAVNNLPPGLLQPARIVNLPDVWWWSVFLVAFTWFQPVLLRLDFKRSLAWVAVFAATPSIAVMAHPDGLYGWFSLHPWIIGTVAALTSTALLIGQRTRPWCGLLGGIAYGAYSNDLAFAFPYIVANVLFGIPLIFGTKPITRPVVQA